MTPTYNNQYEELSEDIFQTYRKQLESQNSYTFIHHLDINNDLSESMKIEICRLFTWANYEGLSGNLTNNYKLKSTDDGKIEVTCQVSKELFTKSF